MSIYKNEKKYHCKKICGILVKMHLLTVICQRKAKQLPCVTEILNQMGLGMMNSYDCCNHRDKYEEQNKIQQGNWIKNNMRTFSKDMKDKLVQHVMEKEK